MFFILAYHHLSAQQAISPRIVNIVNFIRDIEPRDPNVTKDVLYQTVVNQIALMKKHHLGGTFLLQYDALIDTRYQKLLKSLPKDSFEIGAWWELPQPLIEKAGIKWRGKYAWDWHSNVGFSVGYTPGEREKIIDVYFADFKKIFGYYPRSVAAWVIDAHSLDYMYDKYKIVASANCKDQYGTDGFTLWGGYWNQTYYPSRTNVYMPAQNESKQLPVPVFRMLGSDPIRQYDDGSYVTTLEPVYPHAGGNEKWINWFLSAFANDPALGFNYTQAGQENSFTWDAMHSGLEMQMPIIEKLRDDGKVRVETMEQSGLWFRKKYKVTPATTFTVTKDLEGSDQKTIWYDSRFYRINVAWKNGNLRIRDIHLFNEDIPDKYLKGVTTTNQSYFFTLPVVDSYLWGKRDKKAGLYLMTIDNGKEVPVKGGDPIFTDVSKSEAHISWPVDNGTFEIALDENRIKITATSNHDSNWFFELNVDMDAKTTLTSIENKQVNFDFGDHTYHIKATKGDFEKPENGAVLRIKPENNTIAIDLAGH
ncbi:hypothetical protein SAMN05216490_4872 [Mucilaginibacter mallensis]|uniref:Uncharacterized protein n=1 Tax=Mucilaginibacter mallensis TaxID=652787 RepID=A0A1H2CCY3_MUCMA|nr:hypothetical protein SAMN05216490_4872 [Mucilaginibacter mallensis]